MAMRIQIIVQRAVTFRRLDAWAIILLLMSLGVAVAFLPSVPRRYDPCRSSRFINELATKPSTTKKTTRRCSTVTYSKMDDNQKTKEEKDPSFLDARMSEIEAMGGDPFFLTDDGDDQDLATSEGDDDDAVSPSAADQLLLMSTAASTPDVLLKRYATDGLGPSSPRNSVPEFEKEKEEPNTESTVLFEWDGIVDEEAHLDLDL